MSSAFDWQSEGYLSKRSVSSRPFVEHRIVSRLHKPNREHDSNFGSCRDHGLGRLHVGHRAHNLARLADRHGCLRICHHGCCLRLPLEHSEPEDEDASSSERTHCGDRRLRIGLFAGGDLGQKSIQMKAEHCVWMHVAAQSSSHRTVAAHFSRNSRKFPGKCSFLVDEEKDSITSSSKLR